MVYKEFLEELEKCVVDDTDRYFSLQQEYPQFAERFKWEIDLLCEQLEKEDTRPEEVKQEETRQAWERFKKRYNINL